MWLRFRIGVLLALLVWGGLLSWQRLLPAWAGEEEKTKAAPPATHYNQAGELEWVSLQAGTAFLTQLVSVVDTTYNQPNDVVETRLLNPVWLGDALVLPQNTRFIGRIQTLEAPLQGRNAVLELAFHELLLPNGERIPFEAGMIAFNKETRYGGETTDPTEFHVVRFDVQGIGSYNKLQKGGLLAMGKPVKLLPGEGIKIVLKTPLQLVLPSPALPSFDCC